MLTITKNEALKISKSNRVKLLERVYAGVEASIKAGIERGDSVALIAFGEFLDFIDITEEEISDIIDTLKEKGFKVEDGVDITTISWA